MVVLIYAINLNNFLWSFFYYGASVSKLQIHFLFISHFLRPGNNKQIHENRNPRENLKAIGEKYHVWIVKHKIVNIKRRT